MKTLALSESDGVICLSWANETKQMPKKQQNPASDIRISVFTATLRSEKSSEWKGKPGPRTSVLSAPLDKCQPTRVGDWPLISVLRHIRIHALRPRRNPARQIVNFGEAGLLQESYCLGAAAAHLAVDYDFAAGIQFVNAIGQVVQRNQMSANVADLIFVRLTHVEHEEIFFRVETTIQLFYLNFRKSCSHGLFLPTNAAKLVVVYQLRDRGMRAADWAIGILAQFEFAELHAQRVDQQQAPDEGLARTEN